MHEDDDRILGRPSSSAGRTPLRRRSMSISSSRMRHTAARSDVRYFNIYGPRMDPKGYGSVMATFVRQALAGDPVTVYGDGLQSRCFTYIDDCIDGTCSRWRPSPPRAGVQHRRCDDRDDHRRPRTQGHRGERQQLHDRSRELRAALRSGSRTLAGVSVGGSRGRTARLDAHVGLDEGIRRTLESWGRPLPTDATAYASPRDPDRARRACRARSGAFLESVPVDRIVVPCDDTSSLASSSAAVSSTPRRLTHHGLESDATWGSTYRTSAPRLSNRSATRSPATRERHRCWVCTQPDQENARATHAAPDVIEDIVGSLHDVIGIPGSRRYRGR